MRDLLFPSSPVQTGRLRSAARAAAQAFVLEARAIVGMLEQAAPEQRDFVAGEVACVLHVAPQTAAQRMATALGVMAHPVLVDALESGKVGVPHALALLSEVEHLDPPHATQVLQAVLLGEHVHERTPGELRTAAKRSTLQLDPTLAQRRHEKANQKSDVMGRPMPDGMGRISIDCAAVDMTKALAAIDARARTMSFEDADLTIGQRRVAAVLHALGCDRTSVQVVLECPVERAVDLHAQAKAPVWSIDVRMPVAVALGLCDHPAMLAGYGPIGADQARALLPSADLVKACVDSSTGEVLAVDRPVRAKSWQAAHPDLARALRDVLVTMATSGGAIPDLTTDGYVPSEALGRLVDLRDVTSVFPGDGTRARRTERDHRLPYPLGPTSPDNLQNLSKHWHRAKHEGGWQCVAEPDGTIQWTSPTNGVYRRRPIRTIPPPIPRGTALPP